MNKTVKDLMLVKELKRHIEDSLIELFGGSGDFNNGQTYAYVDTLEMLQSILSEKERIEMGLDYSIEKIFPIK